MSTPVGATGNQTTNNNVNVALEDAMNAKAAQIAKINKSMEKYNSALELYQRTTPQARNTLLQTVIPGISAELVEAKKILDAVDVQLDALTQFPNATLDQAEVTQINTDTKLDH